MINKRTIQFVSNWLSAFFMLTVIAVAILGGNIRPDKSKSANEQIISIAKLAPLSTVTMLKVKKNVPILDVPWWKLLAGGGKESHFMWVPIDGYEVQQNRLKVEVFNTSGINESRFFHLVDILYAVADEELERLASSERSRQLFKGIDGSSHEVSLDELAARVIENNIEEKTFILGTDQFGRDLLSRLMAGSFVTLIIAVVSMLLSVLIGLVVGVLGGYFGGKVDALLQWLMNVFWSVPSILLVISITILLSQGVFALIIGIALILWVETAQVVRAEVISIANKDYIKAAKLMGLSDWRILFYHIVPNLKGPILVMSTAAFAQSILLEAGLNFLGVGIQLPRASWGGMVRELYGYIISDGPFLALIPSIAIILLVMAISNFGKYLQHNYNIKYGVGLRKN